jgi:hypothetical protein
MKHRNPRYGCRRIVQQIAKAFGVEIDKDVVRRVLEKHYRPVSGGGGPSWLTFIGHMKDSLWSVDLFCCESITLKTHWVLVVMDQFTRRIIGLGVQAGDVDGVALCRMFNLETAVEGEKDVQDIDVHGRFKKLVVALLVMRAFSNFPGALRGCAYFRHSTAVSRFNKAISGRGVPKYLSTDNDPLFTYHRWRMNLRILEIDELKTVPHTPISHPFVERLIGSLRCELLDQVFFWNTVDLERKLRSFQL